MVNDGQIKELLSLNLNLDDDTANRLELINFQVMSYNNLFMSYINNTCEEANKLNLELFLEKYTELYIKQDDIKRKTLISLLGTNIYNLMQKNNIFCFFNTDKKKIEFRRAVARNAKA